MLFARARDVIVYGTGIDFYFGSWSEFIQGPALKPG